jgi:hypothetical protein
VAGGHLPAILGVFQKLIASKVGRRGGLTGHKAVSGQRNCCAALGPRTCCPAPQRGEALTCPPPQTRPPRPHTHTRTRPPHKANDSYGFQLLGSIVRDLPLEAYTQYLPTVWSLLFTRLQVGGG